MGVNWRMMRYQKGCMVYKLRLMVRFRKGECGKGMVKEQKMKDNDRIKSQASRNLSKVTTMTRSKTFRHEETGQDRKRQDKTIIVSLFVLESCISCCLYLELQVCSLPGIHFITESL